MKAVGTGWEEGSFGERLWVVEMILKQNCGVFEVIFIQMVIKNRTEHVLQIDTKLLSVKRDFWLLCFNVKVVRLQTAHGSATQQSRTERDSISFVKLNAEKFSSDVNNNQSPCYNNKYHGYVRPWNSNCCL